MNKVGRKTNSRHIRLTDAELQLLEDLQEHTGLGEGRLIGMLLRDEARRRDIPIPGSGIDIKIREYQRAMEEMRAKGELQDNEPSTPPAQD